jgi:hypothetical protein
MMIRTLLLTAIAMLAFVAPTQAASLPQKFVGKYCHSDNFLDEWHKNCPEDGWFNLGRNHYEAHEESCRFVKVSSRRDRKIPAATKRPNEGAVYTVTAKCTGEDGTSIGMLKYELFFLKGALVMKRIEPR